MTFEVSSAKKEVLERLTQRDWTPTDLADELDKSTEAVYNHLYELAERGVLTRKQVAAKTRPKTEYSIGDGFVQYLAVLPGQLKGGTLELDADKRAHLSIWNIPQNEFHPYFEELWCALRDTDGLEAVAVYGSVARGTAEEDSDIDLLLIAEDEETEDRLTAEYGSLRLTAGDRAKLCMAQVYTRQDYRDSLAHGSDFLHKIQDELHIIYDPRRIL
jgi:predicted nucleotidyltransferase